MWTVEAQDQSTWELENSNPHVVWSCNTFVYIQYIYIYMNLTVSNKALMCLGAGKSMNDYLNDLTATFVVYSV
jgi:hypothetical protein